MNRKYIKIALDVDGRKVVTDDPGLVFLANSLDYHAAQAGWVVLWDTRCKELFGITVREVEQVRGGEMVIVESEMVVGA